ncbi:MAG: hypothetical protein AAB152_16080 [Candidatus Coatesbacteria bacterium]
MTGAWAKVALLWLIASQVVFLVDVRGSAGAAWASPFGSMAGAAIRIPAALRVYGTGTSPGLLVPWLGMLGVAALAGAGAARAGLAAFRLLGWRRGGSLTVLLAPPAGLLPIALAVQGAGLCGLVRFPVAVTALVFLALAGLRALPVLRRALPGAAGPVVTAALVAAVLLAGLPAIAPERNADALIYHLPIPCSWLEAGRIVARPDWAFAGLAQGQELLVYAALAVRFDERWGRILSLLAAGWIALLVAARVGGHRGGWAALLVLTAPLLSELAGTGKNDALFALAAFSAFLALERGLGSGALASIAAAGWLCGAAYAVKNFGVFAVFAAAVTVASAPRARRGLAAWAALLVPAAAAAVPWIVRNWLTLGSPAYPFLLSVWTPVGWTAGKLEMMGVVFNARAFPVGGAGALLASPLHALAHASPFLLACLPLAVVSAPVRAAHRPALVFLAAWFAGWAVLPTGGVVRFLLPLLPLAAVLACAAADAIPLSGRRLAGVLLAGAVVVQALATLAGSGWGDAPLGAVSGREGLAEFRARTAPVWSEALRWLEGEGGTVVVIGQGTQYPRPRAVRLLAREIEHAPPVWDLVRASRDASELSKRFRQRRIRFVFYNLTAANFWAKYAERFPWSPRDVEVYRRFWLARSRLVRVSSTWSSEEGLGLLYRIDPAAPAPPPASLFLPGTEAVFSRYRQAFFDGRSPRELEEIIGPFRSPLDGILALPAREAFLDLAGGNAAAAARRVRGIWPHLDALEVAAGRLCGVPAGPPARRLESWLTANWPSQRARASDLGALLFNMGLPPALPPR